MLMERSDISPTLKSLVEMEPFHEDFGCIVVDLVLLLDSHSTFVGLHVHILKCWMMVIDMRMDDNSPCFFIQFMVCLILIMLDVRVILLEVTKIQT